MTALYSRPSREVAPMVTWLSVWILLGLAYPSVAAASFEGSAHQFEFGEVESDPLGCAALCHSYLEAGAGVGQAAQAWRVGLERGSYVGAVSTLCGSCHRSGGGYSAVMLAAFSDNNVYGTNSHGRKMSLAAPPPGTDAGGSGLPKVGDESGIFQCSTCHNPHDDTFRPFLRSEIRVLCVRCHTLRMYVGGIEMKGPGATAGTWQPDLFGGRQNPGSHPVGEDVQPDPGGVPPVTIPPVFRVPFSPLPARWSLGGHLSGGGSGGVLCVSCHAVHGVEPDSDDPEAAGTRAVPSPSFLPVPQGTATIAGSARPVANGDGDRNQLCEACHGVGNNPAIAPGGRTWADLSRNVHPGKNGAFSHPVHSYPSRYDAGVTAFPEGWPPGAVSMAGQNVSPVPICASCHLTHSAAVRSAGRIDVKPGNGAYILRAPLTKEFQTETLCDQCHKASLPGHHLIGRTFDSKGVPYLQSTTRGPGDRVTCNTCHTSAHDWRGPGEAALDPLWRPSNSGRRPSQAEDMYNPDMSKTCMDCHYAMDGDAASVNPTMGTAQTVIESGEKEYPHYQRVDRGNGTHYIGLIHEGQEVDWSLDPLVDIFDATRSWKSQGRDYAAGMADGWARFGGEPRKGYRVLVCESCHELEPDRNGGFRHLLLAPYEEGKNGFDEYPGDADGRDVLCEACHGAPKGTHPMTGMVVSRTGKTLNPKNKWVRQEILGNATMDPSGYMSCDSCHQPHDANSASYTMILDAPESMFVPEKQRQTGVKAGALLNSNPAATTSYPNQTYATPKAGGEGRDWVAFCEQCHHYW